jgi:signal transduction histidine kinase
MRFFSSTSLRLRIFVALAASTLSGAFVTGLYAVTTNESSIGFTSRIASVTPKALVLASILLPLAAAFAAFVGGRLARPIEDLTSAAARIAEGHHATHLPRGDGEEVRRLARALTSMRRELEGRPYAEAFLRDAWHDLKTPVAALRATLEILDDDAFDDPVAARRFIKNLRRSTAQLERTLTDLVTLARFETASLAPDETVAIADIVERSMEVALPLAEATRVVMVHSSAASDARLRCDPAAIERALGNLLENAIVASPGGRVAIEIDTTSRDAIVVDVTNEPSSIPHLVRRHLFERAPSSRNRRGSGLGLAIVRAAVEAHGGTVRFVAMGPPHVHVRLELPR